jgi:hypothetical protein
MPERPITASLDSTFASLDDLLRRDADAEAHQEAQERLAYLYEHVQAMQAALRRLRAAAALAAALDPGYDAASLWAQTARELRSGAPVEFRTPGRALVGGHLDLLRLVTYTAASTAVANERDRQIRDHLVCRLSCPPDESASCEERKGPWKTANELHAEIEGVLDRLVTEGSRADVLSICRVLGWLPRPKVPSGEGVARVGS